MKYSSLIKSAPRMLRKEDADNYVGSRVLLEQMEAAGWIQPAVRRHKITLYDIRKLDECCDRLTRGEFPLAHATTES